MQTFTKALFATAIGVISTGMASAQDLCSSPTVVAGEGSFAYDRTGATASGFDGNAAGSCLGAVNGGAGNLDTFFVWTPAVSGDYDFDVSAEGADLQTSVHLGGDCTATCLITSDPQTFTLSGAVAAQPYLVQIGNWSASSTAAGIGSLDISAPPLPPANDTCATPLVALLGATAFDNSGASSSGFNGGGPCSSAIGADMFYLFTAGSDDTFTFDTCGSGFDTRLAVHDGADCTATCLGDNDDSCAAQSSVDVSLLTGQTVLVQVGGFGSNTGTGDLNISVSTPPPPPPANDTCTTPTVIAGEGTFGYDRTTATSSGFDGADGATTCLGAGNGGAGNRDVFFAWTPATSGDYELDNSSEGNDTEFNVHLGADCSATCLVASDPSTFDFTGAVGGTTYLIQIGNWSGTSTAAGPGDLVITALAPPPPPPANDTCATPDAIAGEGSFGYDRTSATSSGFDGADGVTTCLGAINDGAGNRDVFFAWTPAFSGDYTIDTSTEGNDTEVNIHLGADCSATCLVESDPETFTFSGAVAATTYLIQIGNWSATSTAAGPGTLDISFNPPPPANDDCSTPEAIAAEGSYAFNNAFATTSGFDGGDSVNCMSPANTQNSEFGASADDLFWAFTVPCDGDYTFDTEGSPVLEDTRLSLHLGADCTATCITSNDDIDTGGGNFLSSVTLTGLVTGETYLVQVGMWNETQTVGDGLLNVTNITGACPTANVQCDPANNHNQGNSVSLTATFGTGIGSGLHIDATGGPTLGPVASWGFFLVSASGTASDPLHNGILCLDEPMARYAPQTAATQGIPGLDSIGRFDAVGDLENFAGTSTTGYGFDVPTELPFTPSGSVIAPGDTYYYQLWYRDLSSSNLSNMLEVNF